MVRRQLPCARVDRPDLILMDLFMPGIDGVEATRRIMGESPCAILVVTSTVSGHLSRVYQAMGYGALDALDTPTLSSRGQINGAALLLHKIEIIGKLIGKPGDRLQHWSRQCRLVSQESSEFLRPMCSLIAWRCWGPRLGARTRWRRFSRIFRQRSMPRLLSCSMSTRHLHLGLANGCPIRHNGE